MKKVFISYRRDGGDVTAILIRDRLKERGINCFLDVESLRSGPFNKQLYKQIENSDKMVLILPEHGLDRCCHEGDWVRLEVEHALKHNKTIIPVMLRNFEFPDNLPESMRKLPYFQAIKASMDYFDATIDRLVSYIEQDDFTEGDTEKDESPNLSATENTKTKASDVSSRKALADEYFELGQKYINEKKYRKASRYLKKSIAIRESLAKETGTVKDRQDLASAYVQLEFIYRREKNFPAVRECIKEQIEIREVLAKETGTAESYDNLALSYWNLGTVTKNYDRQLCTKAYDIWRRLAEAYPDYYSAYADYAVGVYKVHFLSDVKNNSENRL